MPNWCNSAIAFYQEDGGNDMLDAFFADVQKYQGRKEIDGASSDWVGHFLKTHKVNTETLYCRGFISGCELNDDHVRVDMDTAWGPLPEVWNLMSETYGLKYVYIAEEPGCCVYVNTDTDGRFFFDRYVLNSFDVEDLDIDTETLAEYGERLKVIGEDTVYFDSFDEVLQHFESLSLGAVADVDELNKLLERFGIEVQEYRIE